MVLSQLPAEQLRAVFRSYRTTHLPPESTPIPAGPTRVELLAERHRCGFSLWHPLDVDAETIDWLGRRIRVLNNGRIVVGDLEIVAILGEVACKP